MIKKGVFTIICINIYKHKKIYNFALDSPRSIAIYQSNFLPFHAGEHMKQSYILLISIGLISITQCAHNYKNNNVQNIEQNFTTDLNTLQQALNTLVTQSNLEPQIAQQILNKTNEINLYIQNTVQQGLIQIKAAATISSFLETITTMINATSTSKNTTLTNFKQSAHTNTLRTLLMGAYQGSFIDQSTYTDPYTEAMGFIINNWIISLIFQAAITTATTTKTITPKNTHQLLARVAAGIVAHCSWNLEKKLFIKKLYQKICQNYFQKQNA